MRSSKRLWPLLLFLLVAFAAILRGSYVQQASGGGGGASHIPLDCHTPRQSSMFGNSFWAIGARTDADIGHWEYLADDDGKLLCQVQIGQTISGGEIVLRIAANATTGVTRLQIATLAVADGESLNGTFTDETAQDITVPGTAYLTKDVTFALTSDPAVGDTLFVELFHNGLHANDTLAVNTEQYDAWLQTN